MVVLFILPFLVFISAPAALEIKAGNEISRLKSLTGIQNSHHHKDTAHDHFTCPTNQGRFAHPSDCALYYECKNGWPTLKKCRNNQLYDEEKRQCKDKRRVQCYKDNQDQDDKDVSKELDFKCPYIWGSFPHPVDCSKYYLCVYNVPALLSCEKSELYHEKARKCLDKRKVNCGSRLDRDEMRTSRKPSTKYHTTTTTTIRSTDWRTTSSPLTTIDHQRFHCPFKYGRYPDPQDCSRFYECSFFIPNHHHCPRSLLYDEHREECREAENVRCGNRPGGIKEEEKEELKCPYTWGTFPHPRDCAKYIICVYNVPSLFTCRKEELFDAYFRRCRPKDQVDCDNRIDPNDLTKPPTTRTTRPFTETTKYFTKTTGTTRFTTRKPFTKTSLITTPSTKIVSTTKPVTDTVWTTRLFTSSLAGSSSTATIITSTKAPTTEETRWTSTTKPSTTIPPTSESYDFSTTESPTVTTINSKLPTTATDTSTEYPNTNTPSETPNTVTDIVTEHPITDVPTEISTNKEDETTTELSTVVSEKSTKVSSTEIPPTTMTKEDSTIYSTTKIPVTTELTTDTSVITTSTTEIPSTTKATTRMSTERPTTIIPETTKATTESSTGTPPPTSSSTSEVSTDVSFTSDQTDTTRTKQTSVTSVTETITTSMMTTDYETKPTESSTRMVTKVNTPPGTDCDEDDIDCIVDETGDVENWFKCPKRYGHFPHPSSRQLFIHCDNWHPFLKSCADETMFSPKYLVCMWVDENKGITE